MVEYWNGGMLGKAASLPIVPVFHDSIIPMLRLGAVAEWLKATVLKTFLVPSKRISKCPDAIKNRACLCSDVV